MNELELDRLNDRYEEINAQIDELKAEQHDIIEEMKELMHNKNTTI